MADLSACFTFCLIARLSWLLFIAAMKSVSRTRFELFRTLWESERSSKLPLLAYNCAYECLLLSSDA